MTVFLAAIAFAMKVTLPNILLLLLGKGLRIQNKISTEFCAQASDMVYRFGLPLLLFINLIDIKIDYFAQVYLVSAGLLTTFLLYLGAEIYAYFFVAQKADKGVFVQGVFRSNLGIVGMSFIQNAYGSAGLAAGAVYMGLVTILLNILSVLTLSRTDSASSSKKIKGMIQKIFTNPLIVAIVLALILNYFQIQLPDFLMQTFRYLAQLSLPLALLCAGASFDWQSMRKMSDVSLQASIGRLLIAPLLATIMGIAFGFSEMNMGILFLMTATPVAAASYVMAKAMGGNDVAAANIMGITTIGSMLTTSVGIAILRSLNLM